MGMGRAEQTGRGTGAASGQEVGGRSAGMPPVVICGWAGGPEGRMGLPKLYRGGPKRHGTQRWGTVAAGYMVSRLGTVSSPNQYEIIPWSGLWVWALGVGSTY